jgi:hypothetical protein
MSNGTNTPSDEYAHRPDDGHAEHDQHDQHDQHDEYDEYVGEPDTRPLPFPLIERDDLMLDEAAEYETWEAGWKHGTVSDEEFALAIQRIFTELCMRSGLGAVKWDEAVEGVERLRTILQRQQNE